MKYWQFLPYLMEYVCMHMFGKHKKFQIRKLISQGRWDQMGMTLLGYWNLTGRYYFSFNTEAIILRTFSIQSYDSRMQLGNY